MVTPRARDFTTIVPDRLAVMGRPGLYADLSEDLRLLRERNVGAIVSLTDTPLDVEAVKAAGFEYLHEPVLDFTPPSPEQFDRIMAFISRQAEECGRLVLVHCGAGLGRSGTVAAAYLVKLGMDAKAAIARVRELRPFSVETRDQENAVAEYGARLRGRVN